jgi:ABC-2 type transport system ATP-binding protein
MNEVVTVSNLKKNYGDKIVLSDISFTIPENEIFGLLGLSGAGKTTIINILTGQAKKTEGEVKLFGIDTDKLTDDIYISLGMVLDRPGLFERLTCYQNLEVFAEIHNINKMEISLALAKVNLTNEAKTKAYKLSKGMRQRLAIARAILHKPKLLFFDEPTSGLDPTNALEIQKLILALRDTGSTIFLTTHNMDEAAKLCDRIALLCKGVIKECGAPDIICRKHNSMNNFEILLKDGSKITLPNNAESAEIIAGYIRNEQVEALHSSEPDLATVFVSLTDRKQVEE